MTDDAESAAVRYFSRRLDQHGPQAAALDWGSPASQALRFRVLSGVGDWNGCSLLDVGCGLGDLLAWCEDNGISTEYTGVDVTPGMVEAARARKPRGTFRQGTARDERSAARRFDYVVASGIFFLAKKSPYEYLLATVRDMFALCRKGIAFNSLSGFATRKDPDEFYADPLQVVAMCRELSQRIVLRHDYHPGDFTIYIYNCEHT